MRPRDLPALFIKATKTWWPDKRQPTRAAGNATAIEEQMEGAFPRPTNMRELTDDELNFILDKWLCPYCDAEGFVMGPQGGMMTNILCPPWDGCGARFNIPPANVRIGGQFIGWEGS